MEAPEIAQEVTNNIIETKEFIEGEPYFLTPKNKTFATEFSERGIFRRTNFNVKHNEQ